MKYVGDKKRLEYLAKKSREYRYTPEGLITPCFTWENTLEVEAILERSPDLVGTEKQP